MLENRSIPRCTVIPELAYPDIGKAVDWLCDSFGFTLRIRIANHRAQLNVGDGDIVLTELQEGSRIDVENVDRHHERAIQHGVRILRPPADYPYGERQYSVEDFAGHRWNFTQTIADVDPATWSGTAGGL